MNQLLDPNEFVITRKRKKYKFAKFFNASNCFELNEWTLRPIDILEVGAGSAHFSVELARRYPDKMIVAVDVKADRLQRGAYQALSLGLGNVFFVRARADQINQITRPHTLESLWLTFPDPFPRERNAGRRLTHRRYLEMYAKVLGRTGRLFLKHDNREFFCWSLEQLVGAAWEIDELSFDLHQSGLHDDYKILTSYEQKWLESGLTTNFVRAIKR